MNEEHESEGDDREFPRLGDHVSVLPPLLPSNMITECKTNGVESHKEERKPRPTNFQSSCRRWRLADISCLSLIFELRGNVDIPTDSTSPESITWYTATREGVSKKYERKES